MEKYATLEEFLGALDADKKAQVLKVRESIMSADPDLEEHIKWNAPSYVKNGVDRITLNLINKQGLVKLVFHMGPTRKENKKGKPIMHDASGILEWVSDIRGYVTFADLKDVTEKQKALRKLVKDWLAVE